MNKQQYAATLLRQHGFEMLPTWGSKYHSYTRREDGVSINVDIGPRDATTCWIVNTRGRSAISHKVTLNDILAMFGSIYRV